MLATCHLRGSSLRVLRVRASRSRPSIVLAPCSFPPFGKRIGLLASRVTRADPYIAVSALATAVQGLALGFGRVGRVLSIVLAPCSFLPFEKRVSLLAPRVTRADPYSGISTRGGCVLPFPASAILQLPLQWCAYTRGQSWLGHTKH